MDGPGTITWEEFLENAKSFVRFSTTISDGWELRGNESIPGQAFLFRQVKDFLPIDEELCNVSNLRLNEADEEFEFEFAKDPLDSNSRIERPLIMEHHVLWSMSYTVPVLYFNGWRADFPGINPVSVEEAQKLVLGSDLKYTDLSQAIHPILCTPFLQLHPCLSHELLRILQKR